MVVDARRTDEAMTPAALLWQPSRERVESALLSRFMRRAGERWQTDLPDYARLHRWSWQQPEQFWRSVWEECGVVGTPGDQVLIDANQMPGARMTRGEVE